MPVFLAELPADFDFHRFDDDVKKWIDEEKSFNGVMARIRAAYPAVPDSYSEVAVNCIQRMQWMETPKPINLDRSLYRLYRMRGRMLKKLQTRLDSDDKSPVGLHTLFRGMLRDQEAYCHKMMQLKIQQDKADRQQARERQQDAHRRANEIIKNLSSYSSPASKRFSDEEEDDDEDVAPEPGRPQPGGSIPGLGHLCWLIAVLLSLFLSAAAMSKARADSSGWLSEECRSCTPVGVAEISGWLSAAIPPVVGAPRVSPIPEGSKSVRNRGGSAIPAGSG